MDILEDEILITKFQLGDQDAFDELMRRYKHRIYAYILRSVKNYEDAEELTVEVFFKAYRALDKWKPQAKFSTWLYKIAYNVSIDHHRSKKRQIVHSLDNDQLPIDEPMAKDLGSDPEKLIVEKDRHRVINQAVNYLSRNQKNVFLMNRYDGLQIKEISEVLGIAEGTVKIHLHRAIKKLRVLLQPFRENNEI